ncbi:MFS transporter [Leifsonia flava]|nr:MFS transporter [Leifsonia flava]
MTEEMTTDAALAPRRRLPLVALLTAQLVSLAGNAVTVIAVPLYVLQTTGSPVATGVAGVFATVPIVVGGALGGVIVDRFGFRLSSIVADLASGLTVLAIPVLAATVGLPFWALLFLVFLSGLLDTPGDSARASLVPDLARLGRVPITRAAGAQSAIERSARLLGAAVAGGLVVLVGPLGALFIDAGTFLVSALIVAVLVPRAGRAGDGGSTAERHPESYLSGLTAGFRFLWENRLIRAVVLLVTATNAIDVAGMTVLKPVYATTVLGDPATLGAMIACFAGGALVGSVVFASVGHRLAGRALFVACFAVAGVLPYSAMALEIPFLALLAVMLVSGFAAGAINPMISTVMYGTIPATMRARVFGATSAGVAATMPLGAFAAGVAVEVVGLQATLVAAAVLYGCLTLTPLFDRSFHGLAAARMETSPHA